MVAASLGEVPLTDPDPAPVPLAELGTAAGLAARLAAMSRDVSTGTTTEGSMALAGWSHQSSTNKPTMLPSTPRRSQYESGRELGALHGPGPRVTPSPPPDNDHPRSAQPQTSPTNPNRRRPTRNSPTNHPSRASVQPDRSTADSGRWGPRRADHRSRRTRATVNRRRRHETRIVRTVRRSRPDRAGPS